MSYFQKIIIKCPPEIVTTWGNSPIANLFAGNDLILRINKDNYTRIEEGTQSGFIDFFNGVGFNASPQRIGFNIAITDPRDELALAIKQLAKLSLPTSDKDFKPVTVLDYLRVDDADDYQAGYTTRIGRIWVENLGGTNRVGELTCLPGQIGQGGFLEPPIITENPVGLGRYNSGFNLRFISAYKQVLG